MADQQAHYDVVVVGAGVQGLCAAHTFLMIDPSLNLLILDNKKSVGGVWSKEQLYPGLRANNVQGYYEFSDFPMLGPDVAHLNIKEKGILTGETIHAYLFEYAKYFDLLRRIRLDTEVMRATNNEADAVKAWTLDLSSGEDERTTTCSKLIVATGQTSKPFVPFSSGSQDFRKPIIHSADLGTTGQSILHADSTNHITVLGGSKSAHDTVYMFAKAGKSVTWLTRRTGHGTMPMAKTYTQIGPWSIWLEGLLMVRPLSWFGACPWSDGDGFRWIRSLLHRTKLGNWLVRGYFAGLMATALGQSGILRDEKTRALVPDDSLMWYGTQSSVLTYDTDIYDLINESHVQIIREDVKCLQGDTVILQDGQELETDAIICATGYDYASSVPLEPISKRSKWGVPIPPSEDNVFPTLDAKADTEICDRFPMLTSRPKSIEKQPGLTPWRLWHFIAPPSQVCSGPRSLAFLAAITSYQTTIKCEITSLWTYAYLYNELNTQSGTEKEVLYESALWSRFGRWRCAMGMQGKSADLFHDSMPYYDLLLRELGLRSWRKGWGLLGELFGGWYEVKDYKGIVNEWMSARRDRTQKVHEKIE